MEFNEVIGQQEMAQRLKSLVDERRLPHAMMLCGPDGAGKMALAIALAGYILDQGTYKVNGIEHPDLHFTFPTIKLKKWNSDYKPVSDDFIDEWKELVEKSPYFSLSDWMEAMGAGNQQAVITVGEANELIKRMTMKSNQGGWKVAIVWLPERMNLDCANKLLKLIEEPPSMSLFIFVCREPEKLLETIRSRVQIFDVRAVPTSAGKKNEPTSEEQLFFDYFVMLMRKAYQRDVKDLKRWADNVATLGREEQKRLLMFFLRMTREAFIYNFYANAADDNELKKLSNMNEEEQKFCVRFARFINERNVIGFRELFERAIRDIGQNANGKIVFFDITMKVAVLLHTT